MIMYNKINNELVKARYEYFLQFFKEEVACRMATETLPNGKFKWASGVDP